MFPSTSSRRTWTSTSRQRRARPENRAMDTPRDSPQFWRHPGPLVHRDFLSAFHVGAPPARVWQVMRDVERWPDWTASVRSIRLLDQPLKVGARAVIRQPKFPPAMWRITDLDEGRSFTWVSTAPGIRVTARHSVEPDGDGTRATLSLTYSGIFGRLLANMTRGITSRYLAMEAAGLKARSERT